MPIVPCAPWISLCQEAMPGPYGAFCTPPDRPLFLNGARPGCLPGPEFVAGPEDYFRQASGSDMSH